MKIHRSLYFSWVFILFFFIACCSGQDVLSSESSTGKNVYETTEPEEEPVLDVLTIGSEDGGEKNFDDVLSIPLGLPHKYEFEIENPPKKDISSFSVGTKDSEEESIKRTDKVKLGTPYKPETYVSEDEAKDDYGSRSLGMPYVVKSKIQKEAEDAGY